jgi:nucleoid-associated protein YgaU
MSNYPLRPRKRSRTKRIIVENHIRITKLNSIAASPGSREYTVEPGDTLSYLALRHYGDQYKWEKIYEANRPTMKNPHYIYIGQKIIIPAL